MFTSRARVVCSVAFATTASVALLFGCDDPAATSVPSHLSSAVHDAGMDTLEDDPPVPPGLPSGFVRFDGYDKRCGLYVPGVDADPLAPMEWQPCTSDAPAGSCRRLGASGQGVHADFSMTSIDGRRLIGYRRDFPAFRSWIIGEVDGSIQHTILQASPTIDCSIVRQDIYEQHYVLHIKSDVMGDGALIGDLKVPAPLAALRVRQHASHELFATALGVVDVDERDRIELFDWSTGKFVLEWYGSQIRGIHSSADAVFWTNAADEFHDVRVLTRPGGVKTFRRESGETGDLGTDGKDLVWLNGIAPSFKIQTARYTTNPNDLAPRVVRIDNGGAPFMHHPFVVGCGYAARAGFANLRITNLDTGARWLLPYGYGAPLAITCDELFADRKLGYEHTLVRVSLDALGPATL